MCTKSHACLFNNLLNSLQLVDIVHANLHLERPPSYTSRSPGCISQWHTCGTLKIYVPWGMLCILRRSFISLETSVILLPYVRRAHPCQFSSRFCVVQTRQEARSNRPETRCVETTNCFACLYTNQPNSKGIVLWCHYWTVNACQVWIITLYRHVCCVQLGSKLGSSIAAQVLASKKA